jgi:hypothetical protein
MYVQQQPGVTLVEKTANAIEPVLTVSRTGFTITPTNTFIGYITILKVLGVLAVLGAVLFILACFLVWRRIRYKDWYLRGVEAVKEYAGIATQVSIELLKAIPNYRPGRRVLLPLAVIGLGIAVLFVIIVNACIGYVLTASALTEPG